MMHFHIVTLFPESFESYLGSSMLKRAIEDKKLKVSFYNPRDFTKDKHKRVDRRPYGGGPGMVLAAEPVLKAAQKAIGRKQNVKVIFFSPHGVAFDNAYAKRLAKRYEHVVLIAGHYEGIDARVRKALRAQEVSVGPYTLTGGELPAMLVIDAAARQVPGVLGNASSVEEERIAAKDVYTRPASITFRGKRYNVPKVLLSGHHKEIDAWREKGM